MNQKPIIEKHFNEYAQFWHDKLKIYTFEARRKGVIHLSKKGSYVSVLDIGCGTGDYAPFFDSRFYLGLDISDKMIEKARELYPEYDFRKSDAEKTGLNSSEWDLVLSIAVFEYLDDPEPHMSELARLVKVGGRVIIAVQNGEDKSKIRDEKFVNKLIFLKSLKKKLLPDAKLIAAQNPNKDPSIIHHKHTEGNMKSLGLKYGLKQVDKCFIDTVVIPSPLDQYLHLNPFFSQFMQRKFPKSIFNGYIRNHSRCLIIMFEKI